MNAPLLSRRGPANTTGSQPNSAGYSELYSRLKDFGRKVVAAHLLNHQLFGKGNDSKNLTPIPSAKNTEMEKNIEKPLKDAVLKDNKVVSYKVTVTHGEKDVSEKPLPEGVPEKGKLPEDALIPETIEADAYEYASKDGVSKSEDLKESKNWGQGNKIKTTPVSGIQDALLIGTGGASKIDYMTHLRAKMDRD